MEYTVRPLFNQAAGHRFWRYERGDLVVASNFVWRGGAASDETAVASAYMYFNDDARPNGANERSLSSGDVVQVRDASGAASRYYAFGSGVITPVERPVALI